MKSTLSKLIDRYSIASVAPAVLLDTMSAEAAEDPAIAELTTQIASLGSSIAEAKKAKQPKEEWDPLLQQMLALKLQYKDKTGNDYHPPSKKDQESKKAKGENHQEASDKNKEKRAKKAEEKRLKEEKKRKQREERERREREKLEKLNAAANEDLSHVFGDEPMIQSKTKTEEGAGRWTKIGDLNKDMEGKEVLVRGFLHTSRGVGKGAFVLLRSSLYTVQCVAFESKDIPSAMIKFMTGVPVESIVDVCGTLTVPETPVEGATQSLVRSRSKSSIAYTKQWRPCHFKWRMLADRTWSGRRMLEHTILMKIIPPRKGEESDRKLVSTIAGSICARLLINPSLGSNPWCAHCSENTSSRRISSKFTHPNYCRGRARVVPTSSPSITLADRRV